MRKTKRLIILLQTRLRKRSLYFVK